MDDLLSDDFSYKKITERFYSYYSIKTDESDFKNSFSNLENISSELQNTFTPVIFANADKDHSRFISGFYPVEGKTRWMGKQGTILIDIPENTMVFILCGYIPENFHKNDNTRLTFIFGDNTKIQTEVSTRGKFTISLKFQDIKLPTPSRYNMVSIIAEETIIPANNHPGSQDFRELSFMFDAAGFIDEKNIYKPIDYLNDNRQQGQFQPSAPYFKGKCNVCGSDGFFELDNPLMLRESFLCKTCRSTNRIRQLARGLSLVLNTRGMKSETISDIASELDNNHLQIYDTDSNYFIAKRLRNCTNYVTSDYRPELVFGAEIGERHYNQDISNLSFCDESFDVVLSTDVFEHVRLYKKAIKEVFRVLKPGGIYIFTVPFNSNQKEHKTFVEVNDEQNEAKDLDLLPKVFHGDTISGQGALLYRIYGSKLFEEFESEGFEIKYEKSTFPEFGIYQCDLFYCLKPDINKKQQTDLLSEKQFSTKVLNIELSSICNLRCIWCILDHSKQKEYLSLGILQNTLNQILTGELPYLERIELHNGGETLLHPQIIDALQMIKEFRSKLLKPVFITLLTNGTVLKDEVLQLITNDQYIDEVRISLDGGTKEEFERIRKGAKWEKVSDNVIRIRQKIVETKSKVKLGIISTIPKDKPDNQDWMDAEFKDVLALSDYVEIRYPHSWEGTLPEFLGLSAKPDSKKRDKICKFLKQDLVLLASGNVSVCCADLNGRGIIGNAGIQSIGEIANGKIRERYIKVWTEGRFDELELCSTCEGYYDVNLTESGKNEIPPTESEIFCHLIEKEIEKGNLFKAEYMISMTDNQNLEDYQKEYIFEKIKYKKTILSMSIKSGEIESELISAESYIEQNDYENAERSLLRILNIHSNNIDALNDFSVVQIMIKNFEEAVYVIEKILSFEPYNEVALSNLNYLDNNKYVNPAKINSILNRYLFPPLKLSLIKSYKDYIITYQTMENIFKERKTFLNSLINGEEQFYHRGFCFVCNEIVEFLIDYQYGVEKNGVRTPNWRERVVCPKCELNNRNRAVPHLVEQLLKPTPDSRIYLAEQTTPLYKYFKNRYPEVIGSEFLGTDVGFGKVNNAGLRNEDLTNLTFEDNSFDLVMALDVIEHIPEYLNGFREIERILKPGGKALFTAPFDRNKEQNEIRAKIVEGETIHLLPPEYHGDPVNPDNGCLCYYHFGWDVIEELKKVGFKDAYAIFLYSKEYGYLGEEQVFIIAEKDTNTDLQIGEN